MRDRLLKYLNYGRRFCGVEHTSKNGQDSINVTLLRQAKKELLVDDFFEDHSIEAIVQKLPKNQHIYLVLNNDKVLTKTIESEQQDGLKLVYKAFPNINLDEFYYEVLSEATKHYVALCRKDYIEDIIKRYSELKVAVIDISLGSALVGSISGFIDQNQVYTSNAKVIIESGSVNYIEKTETSSETYHINGLRITSQQLLSFSGALQTVLNNNDVKTNFLGKANELKNEYKQIRFFNLFLRSGGLFILGLLLINFFFFNHYFNKVDELRQLSEVNQSTKNQILKLDEVVSRKQKMVDDLLKSSGSKSSYYTNKVIHSLPNSILLNRFNYQPLLKRIKADNAIELKTNIIEVVGESSNSEAFSNWISSLEAEDWVSKIDIIDYGSASSKVSDFKIEMILSDD
ncbi:hypothetical protein [Winogradskyella sp.]|uniref:hypothetical protein n=1 Tax=Winogradskyella sp. TaxID=1883156 RepID=UPI00262A2359|nr:hypothetical protein [Winogradskyella sp.]